MVWSNGSQEVTVQFLSLGTAHGQSQWLTCGHVGTRVSPPRAGGLLLTSASTSFFFMPSEESSRFCSFSSSRSARSLAWRMFCSSSVASVLAFTAYQERRDRARGGRIYSIFSMENNQGTPSIGGDPLFKIYEHSFYSLSCLF